MSKRYAEGTEVTVDRSKGEVMGILSKHGVERQAMMTGPEGDQIGFEYQGRPYRLAVTRPTRTEVRSLWPNAYSDDSTLIDREYRRRWRALVLLLKAKIEFAADGASSFEREFMPYLITAKGQTLGEVIEAGALGEVVGVPLLTEGMR